jgi:hypothetical protein
LKISSVRVRVVDIVGVGREGGKEGEGIVVSVESVVQERMDSVGESTVLYNVEIEMR